MRRSSMRRGVGADAVTVTALAGSPAGRRPSCAMDRSRRRGRRRAGRARTSATRAGVTRSPRSTWQRHHDRHDRERAAAGADRRGRASIIDGGGSVITTGVKGFVEVPFAGTITAATLLSTDAAVTSGSIVDRHLEGHLRELSAGRRRQHHGEREADAVERDEEPRHDAHGLDDGDRGGRRARVQRDQRDDGDARDPHASR